VVVGWALTPIRALVNGATVEQVRVPNVEYWHVELDAHDIVLAEGLPAESYLDTGNRAAFANGGALVEAHPDFRPRHWSETCLPLCVQGPEVAQMKARLLRRAQLFGHRLGDEADPHVLADGRRVEPIHLGEDRIGFILPHGCSAVTLASRTFAPAETIAESDDPRRLGLCVRRLEIDGEDVALEDDALEGWNCAETASGAFSHRWTTGAATLRPNGRIVIVDLAGRGRYWLAPRKPERALGALGSGR
jgi:hypothetical protein